MHYLTAVNLKIITSPINRREQQQHALESCTFHTIANNGCSRGALPTPQYCNVMYVIRDGPLQFTVMLLPPQPPKEISRSCHWMQVNYSPMGSSEYLLIFSIMASKSKPEGSEHYISWGHSIFCCVMQGQEVKSRKNCAAFRDVMLWLESEHDIIYGHGSQSETEYGVWHHAQTTKKIFRFHILLKRTIMSFGHIKSVPDK